ncbi:MAG TPA: Spy/CpxP family protein refolding chaperone [Thermoanaerobaculia bacterium]|nr:Spy/CpxP family protein refolding chaperone [Thermoanaerobaculia bacterium]
MVHGATFPGFIPFWQRRRAACGSSVPFGAGVAAAEMFFSPRWHGGFEGGGEADSLGAGFGVRRPLRYLAFKLDLSEAQIAELAAVLDELKIERAQAALDGRRSTSALADAVSSGSFDDAKAAEAGASRVRSAERLRDAVARALKRIHAILDDEQRKKLAYLLRTGALSV